MKPKYQILILVLFIITALAISCTAKKVPDIKPIDNSKPPSEEKQVDIGQKLMGETSYIKTITDESAKDAHIYLPAYPGGVLDKDKGSCNISETGKYYNLVYHTDDSVKTVAAFFKKNISEDYLVETLSPVTENWIHLEYKPTGVNHSGSVFIREAGNGSTEIIYEVSIPEKQAD